MTLPKEIETAVNVADAHRNLLYTVPALREVIHYERLWEQTRQTLIDHAHQSWTDLAEHDPGVTLQQAVTYGVADLAYRATHPLVDLLTPGMGLPVFPTCFGPSQVLTVSPVSAEDYRRALLDLSGPDGNFLLRDAQLIREPEGDHYRYWYDAASREFQFGPAAEALTVTHGPEAGGETDDRQELVVLGGYRLYLEPQRGIDPENVQMLIDDYLRDQRNLGEQIRTIEWIEPYKVDIRIDIDVQDDCQEPERVMAELYQAVEAVLRPQAQRQDLPTYLEQGGRIEDLYEGPAMLNGWITGLPPVRDFTHPLMMDLRELPRALLRITGLQRIRLLKWADQEEGLDLWLRECPEGSFPQVWGEDPIQRLAAANSPVRLFKRGQRLLPSAEAIEAWLVRPARLSPEAHTGPWGDYLPGMPTAIDISLLLPACYGLADDPQQLDPAERAQRQRLIDYLALFQGWLRNGCEELAALPRLLAFEQPGEGEKVGSGYWQAPEKAFSVINHLLGYFGSQRAPEVFKDPEFFESQRASLAEWAQLGNQRANVPVNTVSGLNKRLAFRLGIGAELFKAEPDLARLPIYLIEYRSLLPEQPDENFVERTVRAVSMEGNERLILDMDPETVKLLRAGQLVSMEVTGVITVRIPWAVVLAVDSGRVALDLTNNPQLRTRAEELTAADIDIKVSYSKTWLRELDYPLQYVSSGAGRRTQTQCRLYVGVSAHVFQPGDKLVCEVAQTVRAIRSNGLAYQGTVKEVNIPDGELTVETGTKWPEENALIRWHREQTHIEERFSFKVGIVLNRDYWLDQRIIEDSVPEEVMTWVKQVVREEVPAHVQSEVHWLADREFRVFGLGYSAWQEDAAQSRLGQSSYELLKLLSLGQLPAPGRGIGFHHIITAAEQQQGEESGWYRLTEDGRSQWVAGKEAEVEQMQVIHVPRDSARHLENATDQPDTPERSVGKKKK